MQRDVRGTPAGYGFEWVPLEERFALYGGGITTVGIESSIRLAEPVALPDPTAPVHGPFSEDFRWVTVPEIQSAPISLTKTQGAVFEALWSFKGQPRLGSQIMKRAGSRSDKPGDVFKNTRYALAKAAYQLLVTVNEREGLYTLALPAASCPTITEARNVTTYSY